MSDNLARKIVDESFDRSVGRRPPDTIIFRELALCVSLAALADWVGPSDNEAATVARYGMLGICSFFLAAALLKFGLAMFCSLEMAVVLASRYNITRGIWVLELIERLTPLPAVVILLISGNASIGVLLLVVVQLLGIGEDALRARARSVILSADAIELRNLAGFYKVGAS